MFKTPSARLVRALVLGLSLLTAAQAQPDRLPLLESPTLLGNRSATFRLRAPQATKVELSAQFLASNLPMTKDEQGVWSITVGPVEPNLYPYNFVVDGTAVSDPANQDLFPNERFKGSLIDIPGETPSLHAIQPVPHGEVTYLTFESKTLGRPRPLVVYTPPGYREGQERYPVLFLVSGTTDTEETWFKAGRANFILDNLLAQQMAVPMIIVMPYGNMLMGTPRPTTLEAALMYKKFSEELVHDIMPLVESRFRTLPDREKRAIAGFSRGGGQSLFTAFSHLDKFAYIGSYSAYLTPEVWDKYFSALSDQPESTNRKIKLLWLGVGKSDFLYAQATTFNELLTNRKLEHTELITEGGHTWMNARHYLAETLQRFFK